VQRVVPCWLRRDGNLAQAVQPSWSIRRRKVAIWFQLAKFRVTDVRSTVCRELLRALRAVSPFDPVDREFRLAGRRPTVRVKGRTHR
jgi:hypothetical protein